jgi:hypothetical protein
VKTTQKKKSAVLRRYTSLPSLLHILRNKQITLLSPASWSDRNDAFFLSQYRKRQNVQAVLALCFSEANETYHHWRVFTGGSDGVCIEFNRKDFLAIFDSVANIKKGAVKYKRIDELAESPPSVPQLPFRKRLPYSDEKEFRLVYIDDNGEPEAKSFHIPLACIKRITLNPWLPASLAEAVKATIRCIDECANIPIYQTTLLENERWKKSAMGEEDT